MCLVNIKSIFHRYQSFEFQFHTPLNFCSEFVPYKICFGCSLLLSFFNFHNKLNSRNLIFDGAKGTKRNVQKKIQEVAMTSFQSGYVSSPQFSHDGSHMHAGMVSAAANTSAGIPQPITAHEAIEVAGRNIEKMIHGDSQFASLADKLRIGNVLQIMSQFDWK